MKPIFNKGELITWKDERGFGFIKPDDNSKEVFLHISAFKGIGRRPKVGDIIVYERVTEPNGKIRAAKASIQGITSQSLPPKQKIRKQNPLETVIGVAIVAAMVLVTMEFSRSRSPSPITSAIEPGCIIKGNISIETGNKFYHLKGMEDYEPTVIDPAKGEKWFCTESEAIANGWSKALR